MSDLGTPPTPAPETPVRPRRRWRAVVAVAVVLLLVAAGATTALLLSKADSSRQEADGAKGASYPRKWDERIAPYAKIAADLRGLEFEHPVAVRFLSEKRFEKTVVTDEATLDDEDRAEIRQFGGIMRAFGLLDGRIDVFDAVNDFAGAGTLAYYSFDDQRITVRGTKITPAVRSTLVHELTHALQDQHFDAGDRSEKLADRKDAPDAEQSVFDALVEGDATRVEELYRESLSRREQKQLDASQRRAEKGAGKRLRALPKVITTVLTASYSLGQAMTTVVAEDDGNDAVDELFEKTPVHETAMYDPFRLLADDAEDAVDVERPELAPGEKKFDAGEFGVTTWLLVLAERMPVRDALATADGWGGDSYVAFDRGKQTCVRADVTGATRRDTDRFETALRRWVAATPGAQASVRRSADVVALETCDPGRRATVGQDASERAFTLLLTRTFVGLGIMRSGAPAEFSRCLAGRLVEDYPVSALNDPQFGSRAAEQRRIQQLSRSCMQGS